MSSTSSVASQPPVSFRPPVDTERAQVVKAAADDKADEKVSEKAAKVEDVQATAAKAQSSKEAGKGQVLDIQA